MHIKPPTESNSVIRTLPVASTQTTFVIDPLNVGKVTFRSRLNITFTDTVTFTPRLATIEVKTQQKSDTRQTIAGGSSSIWTRCLPVDRAPQSERCMRHTAPRSYQSNGTKSQSAEISEVAA